jgi:hypothetical protein
MRAIESERWRSGLRFDVQGLDLAQGGDLILDGLLIGRYADVNCGALLHDGPRCRQDRITSVY